MLSGGGTANEARPEARELPPGLRDMIYVCLSWAFAALLTCCSMFPWPKLRCHLPVSISVSIDTPERIHPGLSASQVTREIIVHGFFLSGVLYQHP